MAKLELLIEEENKNIDTKLSAKDEAELLLKIADSTMNRLTLTGSRFFGGATDESDIDIFVQSYGSTGNSSKARITFYSVLRRARKAKLYKHLASEYTRGYGFCSAYRIELEKIHIDISFVNNYDERDFWQRFIKQVMPEYKNLSKVDRGIIYNVLNSRVFPNNVKEAFAIYHRSLKENQIVEPKLGFEIDKFSDLIDALEIYNG